MLYIGSHVSFNKNTQILGSAKEAFSYGANTFMFYTGAPQNTMRYPIKDELTMEALSYMKDHGIDYSKVIVHAPYIINLGNALDLEKRKFAIHFLEEEIKRVDLLGVQYLVLHPGSHVGSGTKAAINSIIYALNQVLPVGNVTILLETMAGKGTEVGSTFEELATIIDGVLEKNKIGVCLDTCHINDAGYDISDFDFVLDEFDRTIGLNYLKCVHLNDSKNPMGAHKDRHENLGYGTIGFDNLLKICYHPKLEDIPKILETPYIGEFPPYKVEIDMLKDKKFNPKLKAMDCIL